MRLRSDPAPNLTRRQMLCASSALLLPHARRAAADPPPEKQCSFSIGTYGMKDMATEDAIALIRDIGYDGVELAVRPDWDAEPARMPPERRRKVKGILAESGLKLTALMEHLYPAKRDEQHAKDLERLRQVLQLGHDLGGAPLLQTVLGGGAWLDNRERIRDRVADWIAVGKAAGMVIAVKPHRGGVMSTPGEFVWLASQLGETPWLRTVYDYSHYAFRDMPVAETVATALPYTAHIAIKDAVQEGERVVFKLPGANGGFDYERLLGLFRDGGYRGDICCEVSGMVSGKPGYNPADAAKTCYRNIAPVLEQLKMRTPQETKPLLQAKAADPSTPSTLSIPSIPA